ncbi:MAG: TrkA family potassium uptake protein [Lachnospiraceae bacterium]|nr:TrkA family potassium uptake protein [Lachnospiraceae bacterium]
MKKNANSTFGIVGLGRFGTALAITLAEAGKEVIVVDQNEEKVKAMRQYTEYAFVCDNLSKATLSEVGIQNCDTVIVCIGSRIDTSILTTLNVVSLGVPHVISKATSQDQGAVLEKIGAEVVYPERDMAIRLGKKLLSGNFLDFIFLDNDIEIQQVPVSSFIKGKTIQEINIRKKYGLNIIAIEHDQNTIIELSPDYKLQSEDIIVVIGKVQNIRELERALS